MTSSSLTTGTLRDLYTVAFYNLENLLDTNDDPEKLDDDFTPEGRKHWTRKRYKKKLFKLASTISKLGKESTGNTPVLLGIAEVENKKVIRDLLKMVPLRDVAYDFVHYDSPDERGIDTALIFNKDHFEPLYSDPISLYIASIEGERDTTRDILYVHGKLNGEEVHVFVNHWPSRRGGEDLTEYKRMKAADTVMSYMSKLEQQHQYPNYIVMGDFNDGPHSESITHLVKRKELYNPMEKGTYIQNGTGPIHDLTGLFNKFSPFLVLNQRYRNVY